MKEKLLLFDEFKNWLPKKRKFKNDSNSPDSYLSVNTIFADLECERNRNNKEVIKIPSITETEKNFFIIVPKMIKAFHEEKDKTKKEEMKRKILSLLNLASRTVAISKCYYKNGTAENKRAYFNRYVEFVKQILNEGKKIIDIINEALSSIGSLEEKENSQLESDLNSYKIYDFDSLRTKFRARLRTQDRNSGEKIWLPLTFISKIYTGLKQCNDDQKKEHKDDFTNWLEDIIKSIYIHYYDKDDNIQVLEFNNINVAFLEFERGNDLVWLIKKDGCRYKVATPTNTGNKKEEMSATDINKIDIDHVKPIDRTLKDLGNPPENKLQELEKISNSFRLLAEKDDTKAEQKRTIEELIEELDFDKLKEELYLIKNDSPYRLMDSTKNSEKNNSLTFLRYYKKWKKESHYYGFIDKAVMDIGNKKNIEVIIYQDLYENGVTRVMQKKEFMDLTNDRIVDITKVPKELL